MMRLNLILITLSAFQQRKSHLTYAQTPSPKPSSSPTAAPTTRFPTASPTSKPSSSPTSRPTRFPTSPPTSKPSPSPTPRPTRSPTTPPTPKPSPNPTPGPTRSPTPAPTRKPSPSPTLAPTRIPTSSPTPKPSASPTPAPTRIPTPSPTPAPTRIPTPSPTPKPSPVPSSYPTSSPTSSPTPKPSPSPTSSPTPKPSPSPTISPTGFPSPSPTPQPSPFPTSLPTSSPTPKPSTQPTLAPTSFPTSGPTPKPSAEPSLSPTRSPTTSPTAKPSASPTPGPTRFPTPSPTRLPTPSPTAKPSSSPTPVPTFAPTSAPTLSPTRPIPTQIPVATEPSIPPNDESASTFACPPLNSSINITTDGLVSFLIPTSSQHLCTLVQQSSDAQTFKPVGRSYAGYDWEASSGEFSSLGWSCNGVTCSVNLPSLPVDSLYVLTSFYPPEQFQENGVDEVARFLEQTTFGITKSDISEFDTTNLPLAFGSWIKEQQESVPATSHRAFFRLRTNSRMDSASRSGAVTHPCHKGSTFRRYALSAKDSQKYVSIITVGSKKIIKIDGFVRTVVNGPISNTRNASVTWPDGSFQFTDTALTDRVGGDFQMYLQSQKGNVDVTINGTRGNPIIQFDSSIGANPNILIELTSNDVEPVDMKYFTRATVKMQEIMLTKDLELDVCASILEPGNPVNPVFALFDGVYWIHDPKFDTFSNTLENPFPDGGGKIARDTLNIVNIERSAFCANVERDVFNEKSCVLSYEPTACAAGTYDPTGGQNRPNFFVPVTPQVIRDIYIGTGNGAEGTRYVYSVDGLRIQEDKTVSLPCQRAGSRWIPINCTGAAAQLDPTVHEIFSKLLKSYATDSNPYMRDIWNWWGTPCPAAFQTLSGFEVLDQDGTKCWKNVHPDHLSVYDFTFWTRLDGHPGNSLSRNPIKEFAEAGLTTLKFPWWHSMSRWADNEGRVGGYVGRLGDTVHYYNFPKSLKSEQLNQFFGFSADAINYTDSKGVIVCGSPNEIENDLSLGGSQGRGAFDIFTENFATTEAVDFVKQKRIVWTHIALTAPDQLRQRMAWALSQILVVSPGAVSEGDYRTEAMTAYYDIFVRHAFGSYRDILKEVSYNGVMGQMLTYHGSRSTAYTWRTQSTVQFADENYAREIMQLFTIGMYKMRQDGTLILDSKGFPIRAYTNDDIVEYARVWTGFESRLHRGNVENMNRFNHIDSMKINMEIRDVFPKMGLDRKYIGDGYPLCADLPEKHFLKASATYRLLGSTSVPELVNDPKQWASDVKTIRLKLQSSGPDSLFAKLCGSEDPNACSYRTTVTLDGDILCSGVECSVDTLRVVEVGSGIFYEYINRPCVYQAFYMNAKTIIRRWSWNDMICADPRIAQASTACCNSTTRMWNDMYWGERVTFSTAGNKCKQQYCDRRSRPTCDIVANPTLGTQCVPNGHYWTTNPCTLRVKINPDGTVAIVHSAVQNEPSSAVRHVQNDTKTYFRVDWSGVDSFKSILSDCNSIPTCAVTIDEVCVCNMTVEEEQVFFDGDSPTVDDVLKKLTVGSFEPSMLASNWVSQTINGVTIYSINGQLTSSSIFEVTDSNGVRQLRKNMKSNVKIIGKDTYFRNPVHFISLSDPAVYQAYHETDAALDQYFYHSNTAPFLAIRFAQRFGISNPSPGFVSRIAAAFKSGTFTYSEGGTPMIFGTGKYGSLGATIASILLDREARTTVLDSDPVHGSLREPLIKILGLMRALEFKLAPDIGFIDFDININLKIGQMAHALPNVFSFFSPFFTSGIISEASLVAPEAQVMTGPRSIDSLNGLLSLIKFGLSSCHGGVGRYQYWTWYDCSKYRVANVNDGSLGNLTFSPSDSSSAVKVTDELATLLTAGRLSRISRQVIDDVIRFEPNRTIALLKAQQLIVLSPEFHATNTVRQTGVLRPEPQAPVPSSNSYKAVVYVLLDGGMDSFNLIVPHTCTATNVDGLTVLEQYNAERTTLAMTAEERTRVIDTPGQPCSQFAIHKDLEIVERLYKAGDLSFFVNAGVINQPVNKDNYWRLTKTGLFGHNTMQEEAQQLDPFDTAPGTGVLGRMCDILKQKKFKAQPVTVQDSAVAVVGVPGTGVDPLLVSSYETNKFNPLSQGDTFIVKPYLKQLNQETEVQSSLYGEMWSENLNKALNDNDAILKAMSTTKLNNTFPNTDYAAKLRVVSTLIGSHQQRGTDRDVFYLSMGGWDHHSEMKASISSNFVKLNAALTVFYNEMQAQGKWNGITVVFTSDFARTLTANSGDGSDHAWGGHYFVMGGAVKGGKIHGSYPSDITNSGPLNIGRGRIIPTLSWESVLNPIVEWMGVDQASELNYCMPNRIKSGAPLISVSEMFK